ILRKRKLGPPVSAWVYELTDWGLELETVIINLGCWGAKSPFLQGGPMSPTSFALSLRAMFNPARAAGLDICYELQLNDECFRAQVADGKLEIIRDSAPQADVTVKASPNLLVGLIYLGQDFEEAVQSGNLSFKGEPSLVKRFLALFPLPEPVK